MKLICSQCGVEFDRAPANAMAKRPFCGRECFGKWREDNLGGASNPAWRGGHTWYRGGNWKKQCRLAKQRDGHKCQSCGATRPLQVHHVIPFQLFRSYVEANVLDNLLTLCCKCHGKADSDFWKAHPHLIVDRRVPSFIPKRTCSKCHSVFQPAGSRAEVCDKCRTVRCVSCGMPFLNTRGSRTVRTCSKQCWKQHKKAVAKLNRFCVDCGKSVHAGAQRCKSCDVLWYHANPSAKRRGRRHSKPRLASSVAT